MGRLIIGILIGLLLGGLGTFYFFVGVPRAATVPGTRVQPPDPAGAPAAARIVLPESMFNDVVSTIFTEMNPPSFALSGGRSNAPAQGEGCLSTITVQREGSGVQTAVRFNNNRLEAPIAFTGGYNSPFGCFNFSGWANSVMELRFDQGSQSVFGQLNVETVNLDGVNPVVNALVTPIVQSTLNSRVNPVRIIDGSQTAINSPIASANANLKASVKDVRAEIRDNALNLLVEYDFSSGPFTPPSQP